jgi:hypothetical protein
MSGMIQKIPQRFVLVLLLMTIIVACLNSSCSKSKLFMVPREVPPDTMNVPPPEERGIHVYGEYFDKQVTLQMEEALDFSRQWQNLTNSRPEAKNVDAFGNVPNSSWFTNRHGMNRMSMAELKNGPNHGDGPDISHPWIITRAKAEGVTPGFSIRDQKGDNYVIKFDPLGYPELASGAEVVSTKLFYAMGYNTPENYVVYFHPEILKLGEKVNITDEKGRKRYMTEEDLQILLEGIEKLPDGSIRALASKYLDGIPIGPFKYKGIRKDDLNDFIRHEDRRELRGLRIIAAWLNHFDTKDGNSLDMYVPENEKNFVRHYLIDFGGTLGSASHSPNELWRGHQYDIDPGVVLGNILTLGLYVRPWEKQPGVIYPSIGVFDSNLFDPMSYKPQVPNPAFQSMTMSDGFWAAKIVTSFRDEELKAIVHEGIYSDPEAAAFLFNILKERRDIIGRYFFSRMTPLDHFELGYDVEGMPYLKFQDLAVIAGLSTSKTIYQFQLKYLPGDGKIIEEGNIEIGDPVYLSNTQRSFFNENVGEQDQMPAEQIQIQIRNWKQDQGSWNAPVSVYLIPNKDTGKLEILGIERES